MDKDLNILSFAMTKEKKSSGREVARSEKGRVVVREQVNEFVYSCESDFALSAIHVNDTLKILQSNNLFCASNLNSYLKKTL